MAWRANCKGDKHGTAARDAAQNATEPVSFMYSKTAHDLSHREAQVAYHTVTRRRERAVGN